MKPTDAKRLTSEATTAQLARVAIEVLDEQLWPGQTGWGAEMQRAIEVLHGLRDAYAQAPAILAERDALRAERDKLRAALTLLVGTLDDLDRDNAVLSDPHGTTYTATQRSGLKAKAMLQARDALK